MEQRIVYSTDWQQRTVTIDYSQTLRLFLTQQEHIEFSPKRMVQMVNAWVRENAARITSTHRIRITADRHEAHCELTPGAVNALSHLYFRNVDWQRDYPEASRVLDTNYVVIVAL